MSDQIPFSVRNCSHCGHDFPVFGQELVCTSCRKPVNTRHREASPLLGRPLSFRERQVVDLVALGKLNKEISSDLHLTEGTIKEYLNRIFRKVGITNRTELAVRKLRVDLTAAYLRVAELEALVNTLRTAVRSEPLPTA
jgi:DNA-binding CsgD family transcriptional regulator